jgi:hypothetical protein
MSAEDDELLMREINVLADRAEQNRGQPIDVKAMAVTIWSNFDNLSIEEIEAKVKDVWRSRNLDWVE